MGVAPSPPTPVRGQVVLLGLRPSHPALAPHIVGFALGDAGEAVGIARHRSASEALAALHRVAVRARVIQRERAARAERARERAVRRARRRLLVDVVQRREVAHADRRARAPPSSRSRQPPSSPDCISPNSWRNTAAKKRSFFAGGLPWARCTYETTKSFGGSETPRETSNRSSGSKNMYKN